jgi:hypothetical protein
MLKPYSVGSIDSANKLYCTAIGELHLCTKEGKVKAFPCLYSAQSAGTVISPDNKCATSPHLTQWEQIGDTVTGRGFVRFRNERADIVATLPTYRKNGLWFTELNAIPAEDVEASEPKNSGATIRTIQAPDSDQDIYTAMALTDSDRHYAENMGGYPDNLPPLDPRDRPFWSRKPEPGERHFPLLEDYNDDTDPDAATCRIIAETVDDVPHARRRSYCIQV